MTIDELLNLITPEFIASKGCFTVDQYWAQGRTVYGGLSAALLYKACKIAVAPTRVMRSMTTNFVGPLMTDTPFFISVEIIREGKNVSQVQARAIQNDKISVVTQVCFGEKRTSKVSVLNDEKHGLEKPTKAKFIPQVPKVTPKFLKHIDLSIEEGGIPFSGRKKSHYHGWMRYKKPPTEIKDEHIIGIIDAWPPTVLQMLKWPAPASTISWNLEFIHPHREIKPDDWLAYKAVTRQAADGYGHTEATIWDADEEVIAISRQTVGVFD